MKIRKFFSIMVIMLLIAALTACQYKSDKGSDVNEANNSNNQATTETTAAPKSTQSQGTDSENAYEFEFDDINGNVHTLSDYAGKPVYLQVWASWCSVCKSSLESLDALAAESKDFVVLSVVMPSLNGEKSREKFTEWYNDLGYENLVVMFDDAGQIVRDFGVHAYPTQIMFDAQGRVVYGVIGLMPEDKVKETMQKIIDQA